MPNAIITAIMFVGNLVMTALPVIELVFGMGGATMFVTGALAITAGVVGMSKLMEMSIPRPDSNYARQKTVRSTTAPVKRVYGESLISGPVAFMGVGGTGNQDLWHVIALTGDKSEAITDIYLDNIIIPNADINSGNALGGAVNGTTTIFKPIDSTTLVTVYKYIGGQTAVSQPVANEFFKWTSDHEGQGLTYIATKFSFPDNEKIAEIWNKYNPQDIKALVKGMAIYDPRKDSTSPEYDSSLGVSTHRLSDSTTWQWSDNPALCLANYVIDDQFGMGVPSSAIDWASVHSSADYSDALVSIPNSQTQKRFTCNGVLYGTDSHAQNINKILSSMNGSLVYSSGKYVMQAGQYIEPESDAILTDNDLNGPINITVANARDDRFNTIKGTHFNPEDLHKKVAFPEVQLTDIATRDAGEVLYKEVELPMTNDVYMCQRLTYQMINRSNDQLLIEFPCNLKALRYTVGDRVKITLDKFAGSDQDSISFNQTPFVILGFNFSAEGAVTLTMLKDTEANYIDMPAGNYSQIASDGSITDGFSGVPAPTNLGSVVDGHFVRLTWDNPVPNATFNDIIVYQSSTSNFSDSSILLRTKNDAITFSLPSSALTRYYWVRASLYDNEVAATDIIIGQTYRIRNLGTTNWVTLGATAPVSNGDTFLATASGTSSSGTGIATDESAVSAVVGPETVTTTDQVADSVEWIDVDDSNSLRPANNATVGATLGTDVYDGQAQAYAVGDLLNSNGFFRFTRTSADDNVDAPANAAAFNTAFGRAPTDGDIVVVTNTTSSPNKQAAYQYDGSTFGTISGFFAGDLIIDDTITASALSVDNLASITANLGSVTVGSIGNSVTVGGTAASTVASEAAVGNQAADQISLLPRADDSEWTVGTGAKGIWSLNGETSENAVVVENGPHGELERIWKATSTDASGPDGGFQNTSTANQFPIVSDTTYRFSVFIKQDNTNGTIYLGAYNFGGGSTLSLYRYDGTGADTNKYWFSSDLPTQGEWYLLVGFINPSNTSSNSGKGGIYNLSTGVKVTAFDDFRFSGDGSETDATTFSVRTYNYYGVSTPTSIVRWAHPRVDRLDRRAPSIAELLRGWTSLAEPINAGVTITGGGITMDSGGAIKGGQSAYNNGTGFFLGYDTNAYKFSIGNASNEALTFDGINLAVTGTVNASAGEFSGQVAVGSTSGTITVIDGNDTDYRMFTNATLNTETNQYSPDDSSFKVGNDGRVFASNITIYNTSGDVLLSPTGLGAAALNDISVSSGSVVSTVGGTVNNSTSEVTLTTATASESFSITSKVALNDNYDATQYFAGASTSSTASAEAQLTGVDVLVDYYVKPNGGSYSGTPSATQRVTIVNSGTPSSTQMRVGGFDRGAGYSGSLTRYFAVLQDFGGALEMIPNAGGGATSYVITTASLGSGLFPTAQTYKIKIVVRVVEDGTTTVISGSTTPPSSNNTTTGIYFDGGNSDERHYEITGPGLIKSSDNVFISGSQNLLSSGGTISGDLVITGDLTVQGTTTTINVADLTVADKDITLNYSTGDSSATANNAGIIIQDAVNSTTDASILWKNATDSFEFSHPVNPLTVNSSLNLRSAGGEVGIYLQDSSASNATAFKIYADVTLATSTLYIDYDPSVAGNNWAFVNNGNFLASGTIFADGAASNSLQWEAGYDYSQVGHLPLAGGTLTGDLNIVKSTDALISLKSTLNANDPVLRLEDGSGIATAGFEIWYDNSGGDTHFNSTYDNAAGAIRFHTRTGAAKSSSNERFTITADGAFDFHDGLLGDVQVSTLRTANGIIDSSLDNTVQINSDDHSALLLRTASHANVFSVMPWSSGNIYLTAGGHYDGTSGWKVTSNASTPYLSLFNMSGSGASFYFSTDVVNGYVGTWNTASNRTLWNEYGRWDGDIDTSFGITLNGDIDTTAFDLDSAQGQLNIGKAGDRFTLLEDEDTGYTNTSIGGLGFLSRNAYDSYITSNAYYYRTGGVSSWRSKYSNRHVGFLELNDGKLTWQTSNSAATAANQSASLSTRFQIDSDGGGLFNSSTAINGNGTYVGNAGYHTLTLQDTDGYAGISFKDGNKNWLLRKNGDNDDFEFSYSGNASAQGVGTFASVLTLRDTGNIIVHTGNVEIQQAVLSHNTSNSWRGLSVTNTGDANECTVDGFSSDGTQQFVVYGGSQSQGFLNPTNYNWRFKVPLSGNLQRDGSHDLFDAGNYASSVTLTGDTTGSIPLSTNTGALSVATTTFSLTGQGQYVWDASDEPNETSGTTGYAWHRGITTAFVQSSDGYPSFGSVVRIKTYTNDGGAGELYFPYNSSYGGNHIKFRLGLYNNAGRTAYRDIVDTSTHHQSKDGGFSADVFSYQGDTQYYLDLDPAASNHLRIADPTFDLRGTANSTTNNGKIYLGIYNGPANNTGTTEGPAIIWKPNYSGYTKESVKIAYIAENNYFDGGLSFQTNGGQAEASGIVERFRIRNDNISYFTTSLGIKKTNPNNSAWGTLTNVASIFVSGTNYGILNLEGSSNTHYTMGVGGGRFYMAYEQGVGHMITVRSGSVGVGSGNTSPNAAYSLDVDGDVLVDGDLVLSSSDTTFNAITIGSSAQTIYSNQIWYSNAGNFQIWKSGTLDSGWGGASNTQIYSSVGSIHFHPAQTANQFVIQSDYVRTNRGLRAESSAGGSYGPMFSANGRMAQASVGHTSSGNGEGIFFHSSSSYSIADRNINGSGSTWVSNTYRQLTLDWPTGIRIQTSNEGTYAYSYLDVNAAIYADEGIHAPIYYDQSGTSYYLDLASTGDSLRVAGNIVAYYSDERLKDIERPIPDALEKVKSLTGFYYRPNEKAQSFGYKDKREVGVSAQAVERILPEVVTDAAIDPEYKTVDYARLVPLLIEAIKDLSEELQTLKKDIKENK